jgi:predicted GIY-YIG superfamily endonuclease
MKLVFSQEVSSLKTARMAEAKIKSWKRKDYIEKIVREGTIRFLGP